MTELKFYDVKAKKSFVTDKFRLKTKMTRAGKRKFAIAISPFTKIEAYRIVALDFEE